MIWDKDSVRSELNHCGITNDDIIDITENMVEGGRLPHYIFADLVMHVEKRDLLAILHSRLNLLYVAALANDGSTRKNAQRYQPYKVFLRLAFDRVT